MSICNEQLLKTMRAQAWARAKGEMDALLGTYWNSDPKFDRAWTEITQFVKHVEDNGIVE
ncbi:hypothetical protein BcepSauron_117 [Burkholderia phage BcepSauron]|uniref:Uncharacterized protein n=1 Tax=Burkholderia phage BcepSauron TaxID=2530033 RepID=A0A482MKE7_9CAUD|nr:hypothetical protein H1O17_gp117 [Burkholderia phage BcepSauron]QBQ74497.1 hypothetical protein BcepSauron_117 [Burkholderia phage BcepSauron]